MGLAVTCEVLFVVCAEVPFDRQGVTLDGVAVKAARQLVWKGRVEQQLEWLCQLVRDCSVLMQDQLVEEGLVEQPPHCIVGVDIRSVAVFGQLESSLHVVLDHVEGKRDLFQMPSGVLEFQCDPALLLGEQIHGHSVRVVKTEEPGPLIREPRDAQLLNVLFCAGLTAADRQRFTQAQSRLGDALRRKLDCHIVPLDEALHATHAGGPHGAAVLVALATQAVEVVVHITGAVARVADAEPAPTYAAEEAALQVVVVAELLLTGVVVGLEDVLHAFEPLAVDEGFVLAWIVHSPECDLPDVVGIGEDRRQPGVPQLIRPVVRETVALSRQKAG